MDTNSLGNLFSPGNSSGAGGSANTNDQTSPTVANPTTAPNSAVSGNSNVAPDPTLQPNLETKADTTKASDASIGNTKNIDLTSSSSQPISNQAQASKLTFNIGGVVSSSAVSTPSSVSPDVNQTPVVKTESVQTSAVVPSVVSAPDIPVSPQIQLQTENVNQVPIAKTEPISTQTTIAENKLTITNTMPQIDFGTPAQAPVAPQTTEIKSTNTVSVEAKSVEASKEQKKPSGKLEVKLPELTPQINQNLAPIPTVDRNKDQDTGPKKEVVMSSPTYNQIPSGSIDINKISTNKPMQVRRSGPKNLKGLMIGCSIFFIIILGIIAGLLYYFTLNPDQVNSFIDSDTVKALLKIFTTVFFGFVFFAGFGLSVMNGYRVATVTNLPKKSFYSGLVFGVFLMFFGLATGITILRHIADMTSEDINSSDLVFIQVPTKDGGQFLHKNPNLVLIAPTQLQFSLNPDLLSRFIADNIGNNTLKSVQIDCGNGQTLPINPSNYQSMGSCFFEHKGDYTLNLMFDYIDKVTNSPKQVESKTDLNVASEISIKTSDGDYTLNDDKTEMIMGKAPVKVYFDASKVFSDLKLGEYKIARDTDANGDFDVSDNVSFAKIYTEPKIQTVYYTIPELGKEVYSLLFRVEQSDVPVCSVETDQVKGLTFDLKANCDRNGGSISRYAFHIFDTKSNREVETIDSDKNEVRYDFPNQGKYIVKMTFITDADKQGRAESEYVDVGNITFDVNYDVLYRGANDKERLRFGKDENNTMSKSKSGTTITVGSVPMKLQLNITNISPMIKGTEVMVYLDEKPMLPNNNKDMMYEINIEDAKPQSINIMIRNETVNSDPVKISIPIIVDQPDIIGILQVYPENVGETPFEVTLDASAVKLTDAKDKIVYFTRDFGDGKKDLNTAHGISKHTYTYDDLTEGGTYNPTVLVTTSKGLSKIIKTENPIMVKKPRLMALINIDSHPGQIAKVNDNVTFSIRSDGNIESISWDFGDGETLISEGRLSIEAEHIYTKPGDYKIKAEVTYDNKTVSTPNIKLVMD